MTPTTTKVASYLVRQEIHYPAGDAFYWTVEIQLGA